MRIFLTGATGFIGSHIIPELLSKGHQVLGVTRSDTGAEQLRHAGAEPFSGTLEEPQALAKGAETTDAVIHCAFDHDFTNFAANAQKDARVIGALAEVLKGSDRPMVITSGTGFGAPHPGALATEDVANFEHPNPRVASEQAGVAALDAGVKLIVMRLPQVHDTRKQGLITPLIDVMREKGQVSYVGDGGARWPAAHVSDVAQLYVLAAERGEAGERFHAVDEEGVTARDISEVLGRGLNLPVRSVPPGEASERFGWMAMFAALDMPASSARTRERLGWRPAGPDLLTDLRNMDYAALG